jgi:flagellar assembly protein FliH
MATVISNNSLEKHSVDKYNFKVIALGSQDEKKEESKKDTDKDTQSTLFTPENNPRARATDVDSSALNAESKDSLIESLMQKTDEMSSNFIKL